MAGSAPTAANDNRLIAVVGVLWLLLVTFMVARGIRVTANFQWVLVFIEYLIVLAFALWAIGKIIGGHPAANAVSAQWFNPLQLHDLNGLATGSALAVFFFWGWDTAANVNEESKDANESPGLAGIYSMFILLFIFLIADSAIQSFLSLNAINDPNNQNDILYFFAQQISGTPLAYLMVLAVLSSTVATTQTTLLPSSRLTYSMSRDGVFPKAFGTVHKSWKTPWVGTIISSGLAIIVIVLTVVVSNVGSIFANLILDIGRARRPVLRDHGHRLRLGIPQGPAHERQPVHLRRRAAASSEVCTSSLIAYALVAPISLPFGQSPDWGTSLPIIITRRCSGYPW